MRTKSTTSVKSSLSARLLVFTNFQGHFSGHFIKILGSNVKPLSPRLSWASKEEEA